MAQTARSTEILETITRVVSVSRGNLEEIYLTATDLLSKMEHVDMVMIYVVEEGTDIAVLEGHYNLPDGYLQRAGRVPRPKGITWRVIESRESLNVRDAQTDETIGPAGKALGKHGVIGMPIILNEHSDAKGVIWLWSDKEREFTPDEAKLLSSIGLQIATAIAWAKAYQERRKVWAEKFKNGM